MARVPLPVVNIAIVEDHAIVRDALDRLISVREGFAVTGTASNLKEAFALLDRRPPDVVLADLSLDDGSAVELVRRGKRKHPNTRFLIMTGFCNEFSASEAFDAGASGFILKKQTSDDFFAAIARVASGGVYLSPLVRLPPPRPRPRGTEAHPLARLSRREEEIFRLVVTGDDTKRIAERLSISIKTVETHRTSINRKLGVTSTASLLRFAVAHGVRINPAAGAA